MATLFTWSGVERGLQRQLPRPLPHVSHKFRVSSRRTEAPASQVTPPAGNVGPTAAANPLGAFGLPPSPHFSPEAMQQMMQGKLTLRVFTVLRRFRWWFRRSWRHSGYG